MRERLRKVWRRDILSVLWGRLVTAPLRRTPVERLLDRRSGNRQDQMYLGLERHYHQESSRRGVRLDEDWSQSAATRRQYLLGVRDTWRIGSKADR